jgi:hypothetical protein
MADANGDVKGVNLKDSNMVRLLLRRPGCLRAGFSCKSR